MKNHCVQFYHATAYEVTRDFSIKSFGQFSRYFTANHTETVGRITEEMQAMCPLYTRAKVIDRLLWYVWN